MLWAAVASQPIRRHPYESTVQRIAQAPGPCRLLGASARDLGTGRETTARTFSGKPVRMARDGDRAVVTLSLDVVEAVELLP